MKDMMTDVAARIIHRVEHGLDRPVYPQSPSVSPGIRPAWRA